MNVQFDMRRMNLLKDMIIRLRVDGQVEAVLEDYQQHFQDVNVVDLFLIELRLINGDFGISPKDIQRFHEEFSDLVDDTGTLEANSGTGHSSHPIQVFKKENV